MSRTECYTNKGILNNHEHDERKLGQRHCSLNTGSQNTTRINGIFEIVTGLHCYCFRSTFFFFFWFKLINDVNHEFCCFNVLSN